MPYKYTFIYQAVSGGGDAKGSRMAGWSESYYHNTQFTSESPEIVALVAGRAAILTNNSACVGLRVANLSTVNQSALFEMNIPGTNSGTPDMPQASVLCQGYGSTGAVMRLILRGLYDEAIVRGEEALSQNLKKKIDPYFAALQGFYQRVRALGAASAKIGTISDAGVVHTEENIAIDINAYYRILRTRSPQNGKAITAGRYGIASIGSGSRNFTLLGWDKGATIKGRIRLDVPENNQYVPGNMGVVKVVVKKVGKPFFSYVGRRTTAFRPTV